MGLLDAMEKTLKGWADLNGGIAVDATAQAAGFLVDYAKAASTIDYAEQRREIDELNKKTVGRVAQFTDDHSTLGLMDKGYSYGVARPLSTAAQVTGWSPLTLFGGGFADTGGDFFNSEAWKTAWRNSQTVSPGQASVANAARGITTITGSHAAERTFGIDGLSYREIAEAGDPRSDKFNMKFSLASGAVDGALSWNVDPGVVGGKGVRAFRKASSELRATDSAATGLGAADKLNRRGRRIRSAIDDFTGPGTDDKSVEELMQYSSFKDEPNGAALASLFAQNSGDHEIKGLIWRTAAGNQEARAVLASRRADLTAKIDRATEDIDDMHFVLNNVSERGRVATMNSPEVIKQYEDELAADEHLLDMYNRALGTEGSVNRIPRITIEDKARAADLRHYTLRSGVLGVPVRIMRSPVDRLATGFIQYHDAEGSYTKLLQMSKRLRNVPAETRQKWLQRWLDAPDDASRKLAYDAFKDQAIQHMGRDLGYTDDELKHVIAVNREASNSAFGVLRTEAYAAAEENGRRVDLLQLPDGTLAPRPLDTTELANADPVVPFDTLYRELRRLQPRVSALRHAGATTQDIADAIGDTINDAWRFAVLARLGYGIRNLTDAQIRMSSSLGGLAFASMHLESLGGYISRKRAMVPAGLIRQQTQDELTKVEERIAAHKAKKSEETVRMYRGMAEPIDRRRIPDEGTRFTTQRDYAEQYMGDDGFLYEIDVPKSKLQNTLFSDSLGTGPLPHTMLNADEAVSARLIRARKGHPDRVHPEGSGISDELADLLDQREQLKAALDSLPTVPRTGQGVEQVGPYKTEKAFGVADDEAELNRKLASSDGVLLNLALSEENRLKQAMRGSGSYETIGGVMKDGSPNPSWVPAYLRVVNNHFRQGEIRKRLLKGDSEASVARWLRSPEGREVRRRLVHRGDTAEQIVHANVVEMNHVLPGPLREVAHERPLTEDDVLRAFPSAAERPEINAEAIKFAAGEGSAAARAYGRARDGFFKAMNTFPEDMFARHPFYRKLYEGRRNQMIRQADPGLRGTLADEQLRTIEDNARKWARSEMKRTLFDISSKSTLANFNRFISPFFTAWEDTMVKYGRLALNNPAMIRHAQQVWTAPNRASFVEVVDRDGNPVDPEDSNFPSDNEYVQVNLPGFMEDYFGVGQVRIPKSSANIVLQGDPWWMPGFGPAAQIPVNEVVKRRPDLADSVKFILPFGPVPNSGSFLLPSAARNAVSAQGDDARYGRSMTMIALTEMQRIAEGKREAPKSKAAFAAEIEAKTQRLWMLRTATSLLSPVSVQYNSPYQFYIDEYHRMLNDHPKHADEMFWKQYGDEYYRFTTSLSENNTGIRPSERAYKASRRLKDLISEDPELGWLVVGPDNQGGFSQAVYVNQQITPVKPGSDTNYRGSYDPWTAMSRNQASLGWLKYTSMMDKLDVALQTRGLHSYTQRGAEDLLEIKQGFTADLKKTNPDWADDYDSRDGSTLRHTLQMMQRLATDDRTNKRADVRAMSEYLAFRKQMQGALAQRASMGGDSTLASGQNADLAFIWDGFVNDLTTRYVTFAPVYHRLLETDDVRSEY